MPRPPRIDFANAIYHVTSRGNGRARIFFNDQDRSRFLRQLRDNAETAAIALYAYVLMDNHFHLLVRTPRANLSQFMQRLNTSYALYARYKHRKPGHQFEARFKAKLVQDDTYLLGLTRYIHLNPIKIAACRRLSKAERVRQLEQYSWSSYPGYVAKQKAQNFVCYDVLEEYGSTMAAARRRYRAYTQAFVLEDDRPILEAMRTSRYAIGDERFVEETQQRLQKRRTGSVQDKDLALPALTVDIETVDAYVARHYGIDPADLCEHGHRVGAAKFVAVELACRLTGLTQRAVGGHYGDMGSAAISVIRRKVREGKYDLASVLKRLLAKILDAEKR
jgi:REP element-mobilizing transposase RayT